MTVLSLPLLQDMTPDELRHLFDSRCAGCCLPAAWRCAVAVELEGWFAAVAAVASKEVECGVERWRALLTQQLTGRVCCCSFHPVSCSGCMMPAETWQALSMANALLVADGLLTPEEVRGRGGGCVC